MDGNKKPDGEENSHIRSHRSAYSSEVHCLLKLRLPRILGFARKGQRKLTLNISRIKDFLDVSDAAVKRLAEIFYPPVEQPKVLAIKQPSRSTVASRSNAV